MPEHRICSKRSVVHEDFPEFCQCALSQLHCSWAVFFSILCFLRFHSRSILTHCNSTGFPITSSEASSQNILLEPLPLAPPWGLQTDRRPGRSRVDDGTDSTRHITNGKTEAQGKVRQTRCDGFSVSANTIPPIQQNPT